jgi:thiol-disulfide isomerase/thioredoxin
MRAILSCLAILLLVGQSSAAINDPPPSPFPPATKAEPQAVVVKFTGENCPPCKRLSPKLAAAIPANYKVWEFVAENPAHAQWFRDWNVTQFPTVFIMTTDGRTLATIVGDKSEEELRAVFTQAASKLAMKASGGICQGRNCSGAATCGAGGSCVSCLSCAGALRTGKQLLQVQSGSCPTCPK